MSILIDAAKVGVSTSPGNGAIRTVPMRAVAVLDMVSGQYSSGIPVEIVDKIPSSAEAKSIQKSSKIAGIQDIVEPIASLGDVKLLAFRNDPPLSSLKKIMPLARYRARWVFLAELFKNIKNTVLNLGVDVEDYSAPPLLAITIDMSLKKKQAPYMEVDAATFADILLIQIGFNLHDALVKPNVRKSLAKKLQLSALDTFAYSYEAQLIAQEVFGDAFTAQTLLGEIAGLVGTAAQLAVRGVAAKELRDVTNPRYKPLNAQVSEAEGGGVAEEPLDTRPLSQESTPEEEAPSPLQSFSTEDLEQSSGNNLEEDGPDEAFLDQLGSETEEDEPDEYFFQAMDAEFDEDMPDDVVALQEARRVSEELLAIKNRPELSSGTKDKLRELITAIDSKIEKKNVNAGRISPQKR